MGYEVLCIERSLLMAELLSDGFRRFEQQAWMQKLELHAPVLLIGNAISLMSSMETKPDCIYLDPMFPPKRKKSALAKKSIQLLHELIGDDTDREQLFEAAFAAARYRVVVKSPDYAPAFGGKAHECFHGKLVRYDVYLKNDYRVTLR
jgi:16S rRNA (guanine1516-N2)-methyltransferase